MFETSPTQQSVTAAHGSPASDRAARSPASDELALLEGLLDDCPEAWRTFNDRYSRLIYACITRVTCRFSRLVSQDDVNEIYAKFCLQLVSGDKKKLRSFDPERGNRLSTWLGLLAVRAAYDYLRAMRRRPSACSIAEVIDYADEAPDALEITCQRERAALAEFALLELSSKDRRFIELYYGAGMAPPEVADALGISVKTVYSKKHKIMARLQTLLQKHSVAA